MGVKIHAPTYKMRKKSDRYLKIVEWSQQDKCYVGRCPELMLGGIHGKDEKKVFAELCDAIKEWIAICKKDGDALPSGAAGKRYSGKFNLRLGDRLHEKLAIAAIKQGKSLNVFCTEALSKRIKTTSSHRR